MAEKMVDKVVRCSRDIEKIRNIAICAHIDHGKTTLSDNLLAGAGMISKELAGKVLQLDFRPDEQERGITIDTAAVSMVHTVDKEEYVINLLDTPGHVDFGGDVTRAMRAVDGCVVLVDAVEGVMPQTETVLRQALRERVKPVLFINKVDRLITQQQCSAEQIHERFLAIITDVNRFIARSAEPPYAETWQVNVQHGTVAFGSALHTWALSLPFMHATGITFKDVISAYAHDTVRKLADKAPLHRVVLSLVVHHLPDPSQAQQYRIPKMWHGVLTSPAGQALLACDAEGPAAFVITKIIIDPQMGDISCGRLFSGTLHRGDELYQCDAKKRARIQQLFIYNGAKREIIDEARAGNIIGVAGLKTFPGDTAVSNEAITPFEHLAHLFEPVVTKSIEPRHASELSRLAEVLEQVKKEDPCITIDVNKETGEHLISGMGELHLEVIENRIRTEKHLDVITSPPIVVYRESVAKNSPITHGISPNKLNTFSFTVMPLPDSVAALLKAGTLHDGRFATLAPTVVRQLRAAGITAGTVKDGYHSNIFIDAVGDDAHDNENSPYPGTKAQGFTGSPTGRVFGIENRRTKVRGFRPAPIFDDHPELLPLVLDQFEDVMRSGPLCREPCIGVLVTLTGCALDDDLTNRGPAQIYPAVRDGIRAALLSADPFLLEPKQVMLLEAPEECTGDLSKLVANRHGQLLEMNLNHGAVFIKAKMPVAELFGFANTLRSATTGRGSSAVIEQVFEKVSDEQHAKLLPQIRKRKGMY